MKVCFDGLRRNIGNPLTKIINTLNGSLDNSGMININAEEIQKEMDDLRQSVGFLYCVYEPGDELFTDISSDTDNIPWFNPEPDEVEDENA